jgi:hypothetical protein
MIRASLEAAWGLTSQRPVLALSAAATVGLQLLSWWLGADEGFWLLPMTSMQWLAAGLVGRFWLDLCVMATGLQVLRTGWRVDRVYWVPATTAFQAGFIAMAITIPIFAGLLFLVLPGLVMAIRWSQSVMSILDGRSDWFESVGDSWAITSGSTIPILVLWVIVGLCLAVATWLSIVASEMLLAASGVDWMVSVLLLAVRIVANAFGLSLLAAIYFQLVPDPDDR